MTRFSGSTDAVSCDACPTVAFASTVGGSACTLCFIGLVFQHKLLIKPCPAGYIVVVLFVLLVSIFFKNILLIVNTDHQSLSLANIIPMSCECQYMALHYVSLHVLLKKPKFQV